MKNKFLLLLLAGMSVFTACNDDDDKKQGDATDLNGTYTTLSTDYALSLNYSDVDLLGKSVEFNTIDGVKASLKLLSVIPGEQETLIENIALEEKEEQVYSFTAESKNDARVVNVIGTVQTGKLGIDLNVVFAKHELMAKWMVDGVHHIWNPATLAFKLDIDGEGGAGVQDIQVGLIQLALPMLSNMLKDYLQDVTFREDGNIVATYNAAEPVGEETVVPEWKESSLNLVHYVIEDNVCRVFPNVEMIMQQVEADKVGRDNIEVPVMSMLSQLLAKGVPVNYEMTDTGVKVFIDEVFIKSLSELLPLLSAIIPNDMIVDVEIPVIGGISIKVKDVVDQLPEILEQTEQLEIGLNLVKATEAK